ncbi:hypothetical protein [Actinomadura sp. 7K507]|uniref:hypothetical protein n=1 Tax=Actinomadura sp. 7K507 TaxID=2530365 RepID=UPI00104B0AFC|nr:hypothetical protein [Actinomadura sp. 7K507]TDC87245.1 hypothetical protein E1285_21005 [Actinomadura sp. 7K507]
MVERAPGGEGQGQRLSVGAGGVAWLCFWLILMPIVVVPAIALVPLWRQGGDAADVGVGLAVLALIISPFIARVGVTFYRSAFWLDGNTLVQRRIGRNRRWDLRETRFRLQPAGVDFRGNAIGPALLLSSGSGTTRLPLGTAENPLRLLPREELRALTGAISAARPSDPTARAIVMELARLAGNPLGPI